MPSDVIKLALDNGFDRAYLLPDLLAYENGGGCIELNKIMPEAKSVLLLFKRHFPFKSFPKGKMEVHSHYPNYQKAYLLHKKLIEKLTSLGVIAKSANIIPLKSYAAFIGLSFLKNSLIHDKEFGSYFSMQAIAVNIDSDAHFVEGKDLCKDCNICQKACPMGAIKDSGGIDVKKCIRSHVPVKEIIPEELRVVTGRGYIGCGICQRVCPLNKHIKEVEPPQELVDALDIERILSQKGGSAVRELKTLIGSNEARPGRALATTCMIAGNERDKKYIPYLDEILNSYDNPLVRAYAAWALGKLEKSGEVLQGMFAKETDVNVKNEIILAINGKNTNNKNA